MSKRNVEALTSGDLLQRLRARYPAPEWAFFEELRGGTGFARESRLDAFAMNLYPSRGLEVHGFEVKVSRGDWLRELKQPDKAEVMQKFCDRWWVVLGADGLVLPGELPPTWGLMVPRGDGLVAKVDAPKLHGQEPDRTFVAALLRRAATEDALSQRVQEAVVAARRTWTKDAEKQEKAEVARLGMECRRLQERIEAFQRASGVDIDTFNASHIGAAVKHVLESGHRREWIRRSMEELRDRARELADSTSRALADWTGGAT